MGEQRSLATKTWCRSMREARDDGQRARIRSVTPVASGYHESVGPSFRGEGQLKDVFDIQVLNEAASVRCGPQFPTTSGSTVRSLRDNAQEFSHSGMLAGPSLLSSRMR